MDLLLATSNPGKITELRELLAGLPVTLRTLTDFPDVPDCPENEPTFEKNAIVKAKYYAERTGLPTLADDGGIEIDTLSGWPGVHSRRLFGDGRRATDEEMVTEVLRRMESIPAGQRGCQMRSVVAFAAPLSAEASPRPSVALRGGGAKAEDGTTYTGEGIDRGTIAEQASSYRIPGFPFRSIFFHPGEGMTTAEAVERGARMADVMTHRRTAIAQLLPALTEWIEKNESGRL